MTCSSFLAGSLAPEDRFAIQVNGKSVPESSLKMLRAPDVRGFQVPFPLNNYLGLEWIQPTEELRFGPNELVVTLIQRTDKVINPLQLEEVRPNLAYT